MAVCCPGLGSFEETLRQGFLYMPSTEEGCGPMQDWSGCGRRGQGRKGAVKACCLGQSSPKVSFHLTLQGRSGVEVML